ncbi:MAG: hypothetical protein WKF75_04505 [Singulisphaera sp.]
MTNPSGLGVLTLGGFLLGDRRVTGQLVQVGDDAGQHPEHTGSVECDVLRLGIGLGPQVHNDPLSAIQAFQPLAALAESLQLAREVSPKVRLTWAVRAVPPALLTGPPGDLAGLLRTEELVDPARAETGSGCDLMDGQPRLIRFDDSPDPLPLGFFQTFRGETESGGELLLAPDPLSELVVGFRPSRLSIGPTAVQKTGRLTVVFCPDAT